MATWGRPTGQGCRVFCNDAKEIVSARTPSPRDVFQMKDVTRGPSMHNEQFEGLTWLSVPLFDQVRVWLLGASDAAAEVSALAAHVGFAVTAVDYDPAYLSPERFPDATRVLLEGGNFDGLANLDARARRLRVRADARPHVRPRQLRVGRAPRRALRGHDGLQGQELHRARLVIARGATEEQWERIKRPIGLKFGAKTPAELAIAIVAELVDVRYRQRYSAEAQAKHDASLGR